MRLHGIAVRLRALFSRASAERELDEELRYHVDREVERLVAAGAPPNRARLDARRLFGNTSIYKEEIRDACGSRWIERTVQDLT
jgi:putative ABC transport system permease protein